MTTDQLAAALVEVQGFLVIASTHPMEIGECYSQNRGHLQAIVRVISETTREEFERQNKLAEPMWGGSLGVLIPEEQWFYRVEAAD